MPGRAENKRLDRGIISPDLLQVFSTRAPSKQGR
nr:MAG TPA: hypothetical protein [Caudoviricetes sp.]